MATYTVDKINYNSNIYTLQDSGALQLTGGSVTGPVTFGDSVAMDTATIGDIVVNGSASFTNKINGVNINKTTIVPFVKGTQTGATGSWTGVCNDIDELYDGLTIAYWLPYAGNGNATLNLTINGTATGAKNCYYNGANRLTIHYGAGNIIYLTYQTAANVNGTTYEGWWAHSQYYSDYTVAYSWTSAATAAKTFSANYFYSTATKQWFHVCLIYGNTYAGAITFNINGQGAKAVYINGVASSSSNYSLAAGWYTVYWDGTNFYVRTDGKITGDITGNAATVNGLTVQTAVPSGAKFTDTVTTATTTGSGNAVTAVTASNGALTVTKGTTFLTSHQDISGKADKSATVSTVTYDSTNQKITKTINGTTTDVVTVATLKTALGSMPPSTHSHDLSIATSTGTNQITLAYGTKYAITAGGTSYVFTMPASDNTNTTYTLSNALSSHKFTSTLTAGGSGSGTSTATMELAAGTGISLTDDTTNKKITIASTVTNTDTKVTQDSLNGTNSARNILMTPSLQTTGSITNTVTYAKNMTYNDSRPILTLTKASDNTKLINIAGDTIQYKTGDYYLSLNATTQTSGHTINFPDKAGTVALTTDIPSVPTSAASSTTGITASTTATKTTLGTAFTIPNVTSAGSASTWSFTDITVPIRADSDTTVPTAASSATACDDITAWSAGSGSFTSGAFSGGSGSFSATVTNHVLSFSHTHTAATHGADSHTHTAPSLSYTARSITGVSGSTTVRGVKTGTNSTTTASKASGSNGSAPTLGTAFTVPNVTGNTSATVSITDNGHTHTLS